MDCNALMPFLPSRRETNEFDLLERQILTKRNLQKKIGKAIVLQTKVIASISKTPKCIAAHNVFDSLKSSCAPWLFGNTLINFVTAHDDIFFRLSCCLKLSVQVSGSILLFDG